MPPPTDASATVVLAGHTDRVTAVAWLDDGRLATGSFDKTIRIWNVAEAKVEKTLAAQPDQVLAVAASPRGQHVAFGGKDRVARLWNLESSDPPKEIASHIKAVFCVAFSPDGRLIASCGEDDTRIFLWDVAAGKALRQLLAEDPDDKNQRRSLHGVAFSPDGKHLASCGADRTVRLWDIEKGLELRRMEGAEYVVFTETENKVSRTAKKAASERSLYCVAFSPDGKLLAAGGLDKTIRIWDAISGELIRAIAGHDGFVHALAFDGGHERLISGGHTGRITVWNVADGKPIFSGKVPDFAAAYSLSPNGSQIAAACHNSKAYVVSLR